MMQNRLLKNKSQKYMVGDKLTLVDIDSASIAFSYFLNENNRFYKEQRELLEKYPELKNYYEGLHKEFEDYFKSRPQGKPFWVNKSELKI